MADGDGKIKLRDQTGTCCDTFAKVKDCGPPGCPTLAFDGLELCLFDSIASEVIDIAGTPLDYWRQDVLNSTRDPVYDEPIERVWKGPYRFRGLVEFSASNTEAREEGTRKTWNTTVWIPRVNLEKAGAGVPLEGDVLRFWHVNFYKTRSTIGENVPGAGYYFDVTNVDEDPHIFDSANFVGFRLTVARRTEFTPERRLGL